MELCSSPRIINLIGVPVDSLGGLQRTARDVHRAMELAGARVETLSPPEWPRLRPALADAALGHLWRWRRVSALARGRPADLVIGHNGAGWGLPSSQARINAWQNESGEYSRWTWPVWHPNRWKLRLLDTAVERAAARHSHNIAVSRQMAGNLRANAGVRVRGVIENAVDCQHFAPLGRGAGEAFRRRHGLPVDGPPLVLYAGRPVNYKGLWLLRDWLLQFCGRIELILAGPDHAPPGLDDLPGVHAIGRIDYPELPELYAAADFFALPSYHEGCSYAVIEAMACGVAPLISHAGHGATIARRSRALAAVMAPLDQMERLTGVLDRWLRHPLEAVAMRRIARRYALKYHSMERFQRQWVQLANDVLERHARP